MLFQRLMAVINHWARTGEWREDEFRARRIGPFSSGLVTALAYSLLVLIAIACAWLALTD